MIVLASQSPRRKELMHRISDAFIIDVSNIDESTSLNLSPLEAVQDIAKRKGLYVAKRHPHDIVISADTIVVIDDQIIGKPVDEADARRILRLLSGRTHEVITAYCFLEENRFFENYVISKVIFNELDDDLIDRYIKTGSPMDKAGAYGAQDSDLQFPIVKEVIGDMDNVIGFPVTQIKLDLQNFKK